ncbi:MAG TPA: signal peptidase I [Candidatus Limiplasma sp.]|nr:signal peptidase I [Candidatus Limiplasma sp.]
MQTSNDFYTTREEVEALLQQTLDSAGNKNEKAHSAGTAKKKSRIIVRVIYILLIAAMLAMLGKVWYQKLNDEIPSLFGYQIYVVETGSMIPTLPIGTNILVRQLTEDTELSVGDIITYTHGTAAVTHRIVEIVVGDDGVTRYQTKGDNPDNSMDPWLVEREDVHGVVIWHFSLASLLGQ